MAAWNLAHPIRPTCLTRPGPCSPPLGRAPRLGAAQPSLPHGQAGLVSLISSAVAVRGAGCPTTSPPAACLPGGVARAAGGDLAGAARRRRGDGRGAVGPHRQPRAGRSQSPAITTTATGGARR